MHKIGPKISFPQKSSEIWYTSHVRVLQNSQMHKIGPKIGFPQKSSEIIRVIRQPQSYFFIFYDPG